MMEIRAGFDIAFDIPRPTPMILMLTIHPSRLADHRIAFTPRTISHDYKDMFGNICTRILAPPGEIQIKSDFVIADSGLPDAVNPQAAQLLVERLPDDVLVYLVGSRYCDTRKLSDFAWSTFGATPAGWRRVQTICDYVHDRIAFSYSHARTMSGPYRPNTTCNSPFVISLVPCWPRLICCLSPLTLRKCSHASAIS
jgi:transglutaminase-like putative cysteine protease